MLDRTLPPRCRRAFIKFWPEVHAAFHERVCDRHSASVSPWRWATFHSAPLANAYDVHSEKLLAREVKSSVQLMLPSGVAPCNQDAYGLGARPQRPVWRRGAAIQGDFAS